MQQHKKDPGRNEGYINEIKKNLQGTNSGGGEAENQINGLEHKEEKRIKKNEDRIRSL